MRRWNNGFALGLLALGLALFFAWAWFGGRRRANRRDLPPPQEFGRPVRPEGYGARPG